MFDCWDSFIEGPTHYWIELESLCMILGELYYLLLYIRWLNVCLTNCSFMCLLGDQKGITRKFRCSKRLQCNKEGESKGLLREPAY